ncbi:hypothetical protein OAL09_11660, partial [Verrucomicrobia bacterium]|nr:hypothetical protein [Verrucomicrobiota bacterium]
RSVSSIATLSATHSNLTLALAGEFIFLSFSKEDHKSSGSKVPEFFCVYFWPMIQNNKNCN